MESYKRHNTRDMRHTPGSKFAGWPFPLSIPSRLVETVVLDSDGTLYTFNGLFRHMQS